MRFPGRTLAADLDGDGLDDVLGRGGEPGTLAVRMASGATSVVDVGEREIGRKTLIGAEDADGDGRAEAFVQVSREYGRFVQVVSLVGCTLRHVTNVEGDRYEFLLFSSSESPDAGPGERAGMGCVDADDDGRRELVGTDGEREGDLIRWRRTVVELEDGRARNGPLDSGEYTVGEDDEAIALLFEATCGENPLETEIELGMRGRRD